MQEFLKKNDCAGFLLYFVFCTAAICVLIFYLAPKEGSQSVFIYIGICSLVGSLSVMSVKVCPSLQILPAKMNELQPDQRIALLMGQGQG